MSAPSDRNTNVVLGADVSGYTQGMSQADRSTRSFMGTLDALSTRASHLQQGMADKFKGFGKGITAGLTGATADAATFEKQLSTLASKAAITGQSLNNVKNGIRQTFRDLPVSRGEVVQMSEALEQMGVRGSRSLQKLSETYLKLGAATGEGPIELANGMEQLNRQMGGTSADQAAKYANSLLTVSTNAGVAATSVASFASDLAPIGRAAGVGEAALIGISGAFVKSGQDGRVAANAFNSIMYDIVRNIRQGSPEISKYADLLGVSAKQFKQMSGTDQAVGILTKLGGAGGAQTLENWGMEGIRTQAAIAGVTQSGDLTNLVKQSMGASTNTENLDKGAAAAMGGLVDQMAKFRNQLTDIGGSIGEGFLGPVTKLMEGFTSMASMLATAVHAFAPLIDVIGTLTAGLSTMIGLAAQFASVIGAFVLGRLMLRGTGVAAFKLGRLHSQDNVDPARIRQGAYGPSMQRAQARMDSDRGFNRMQTMGYSRGLSSGSAAEDARRAQGGLRTARTMGQLTGREMLRMAMIAPGRAASWAWQDTRKLTQDAMRNDFARRGLQYGTGGGMGQALTNWRTAANAPISRTYTGAARSWYQNVREYGRAAGQMIGVRNGNAGDTWRDARNARTGFVRSGLRAAGFRYGAFATAVAGDSPKTRWQDARSASREASGYRVDAREAELAKAGKSMSNFERSLRSAGAETVAFGRAAKGAAMGVARQGLGAGAVAAGGVARGVGALMGAATSAYGMIALTAGTMMYQHYSQKHDEQIQQRTDVDNLTPVKSYADQLGIASTALGSFTGAVDDAAAKLNTVLNNVTAGTSLVDASTGKNVARVGDGDRLDAQQVDTKNQAYKNISSLKSQLGNSNASTQGQALGDMARSMNFTDRREVQLFKAQAIKAGFGDPAINAALSTLPKDLAATPKPGQIDSFAGVGKQLQADQLNHGMVWGVADPKKRSIDQSRGIYGGIQQEVSRDQEQYGNDYAGQRQLANLVSFLSSTSTHLRDQHTKVGDSDANQAKRNLFAINMHDAFSTKKTAAQIEEHTRDTDFGGMKEADRQKAIVSTLQWAGADLKGMVGKNGTIDPAQFKDAMARMAVVDNPTMDRIRAIGPFGRAVADSKSIQEGVAHPEDPTKYPKALTDMLDAATTAAEAARKGGDKYATAAEQIDRLGQAAGSTSTNLYAASQALKAMEADRQKYVTPTLSRAGQTAQATTNWVEANRIAKTKDARTEDRLAVKPGGAAYDAFHDQQESDRQYMVGMISQVLDFNKQMKRATEDYQHSMDMQGRQFQLSMSRSAEDFQRSQRHNLEDFNRTLRQQSEDTAKSIYEPFQRVQPQYVTDAASVEANLRDQNQRIQQQYADLARLRRMGISQGAIDTLNLADPSNAQQTSKMVMDLTNDPKLINQINSSVGARLAATTQLTQSTFSQTYRRTIDEFTRQTSRAVGEYQRQRARAFSDNTVAVNEMARQHKLQMDRARVDMADSLRQITGDVATLFPKALKLVNDQMAKYAPKLAPIFVREINKIRDAYNGALGVLDPEQGPGKKPGKVAPTRPAPKGTHTAVNDIGSYSAPTAAPAPKHNRHSAVNDIPTRVQTWAAPPPGSPKVPGGKAGPVDNALFAYVNSGLNTYEQLLLFGFSTNNMKHYNATISHLPRDYNDEAKRQMKIEHVPAHFNGGIITKPHIGSFAEQGPEMAIPLNGRGQAFLADMYRAISASLVSQMHSTVPVMPTGTGTTHYDYRTEISGPITVEAPDPKAMFEALDKKKRLDRLTRPAGRH